MATFNSASNNVVNNSQLFQALSNDTNSSDVLFRKARTSGSNLDVIISGDELGQINYYGYDGSAYILGASQTVTSEGVIAAGVIPTNWQLATANSAGANTLRLTINSVGLADFTGSMNMPNTNSAGTEGVYSLNGIPFLHNWGGSASNVFLGRSAGNLTLTTNSINNTVVGTLAGTSLIGTAVGQATSNSLYGNEAGQSLENGSYNTLLGDTAGVFIVNGDNNICIGFAGGGALTTNDSNNIIIGNVGVVGDNQRIRIGSTQTSNFQAGIYGVTPANPYQVVVVGNDGELGSTTLVPMGWVNVTGTTQAIDVNTYYLANNAATITFTLPATAALGDVFRIAGANSNAASRWTIAQNANQAIVMGSVTSTVGIGGSTTSTSPADAIELVCTTAGASTRWTVISSMGMLTIV